MAYERSPAFQFYPQDFLADDKVQVMPPAAVGCYWLLCCHAWLKQKLPNDMETLRKLARYQGSRSNFEKRIWIYLVQCFRSSDDGWIHPRLERERQKQAVFRENGRKGGVASAKRRSSLVQANGQAKSNSSSSSSIKNSLVTTNGVVSTVSDPVKVVKNRKTVPSALHSANGNGHMEKPNQRLLTKLAHEILKKAPKGDTFPDWCEEMKTQCARLDLVYNSEAIGKAFESALMQKAMRKLQ